MDLVEAHGRFAGMDDREAVPVVALIEGPLGKADGWPIYAAALASLSGWLEDCDTDADLMEAAAHGWSLLNADVLDAELVEQEACQVIADLMAWAERGAACSDG